MSRRTLALLGLTVALGGGVAVLPTDAAGPACVTYGDPAGDGKLTVAVPAAGSQTVDSDDDLDILGLTLNNTKTELIANIEVKKLAANPAKAPGHGFTFGYTFNERKFLHSFYKYGQSAGDQAAAGANITYSSSVNGTTRAIPVSAAFDAAKNLVTLKVKLADLEPWAFAPAFNAQLTALNAASATDYFATAETYDTLTATESSYRVRYGCGDDVVDIGTPPKPPVKNAPDVAPRAGCYTADDKKGDGTPTVQGPVAASNEPDLDIVGFAVNTTASDIKGWIQVDKLGDKPANFVGDRFELLFGFEGKTYTLAGGRVTVGQEVTADQTRGQLNGTTNANLKPTVAFDKAKNLVSIAISRAKLEQVHGGPIPLGSIFTGVQARTWGIQPALQFPADTATNAADTKYTVGYSRCFLPPGAVLTASGGTPSVQYGDTVQLSAKLADDDGTVLSGKTVTFTLGGRSANATTNGSGVATASLVNTVTAGAGAYTVSFAGDSSTGPGSATLPITIREEVTKLTLSVAKAGSSRTVTATLKDDDGKPVAGETVTWTINGKAAGSGKTDSLGRVVLRTAKPTQTVVAKYAGVTDKYSASQATQRV